MHISNIKVKEKEIPNNKEAKINTTTALSENSELEIVNEKDKESGNKLVKNSVAPAAANLEVANKNNAAIVEDSIKNNLKEDNLQKNGTILFDAKKNNKRNRNKKVNLKNINAKSEEILNEEAIDNKVCSFTDGDISLGKDESVVAAWSFG